MSKKISTIIILKQLISRKSFLIFFLLIFVIQSSLIAISFKYPMVFDERFHFDVIKIYSSQISPIITNQSPSYDEYGSLSFGSASLYHYLLSFPLRILRAVGLSMGMQVVTLRVINILFVVAGLYIFSRIFVKLGVKKYIINLSILLYSLIPLTTLVAATVSYDNLSFLIFAAFLCAAINIFSTEKLSVRSALWFIVLGIFGVLVKFTFMPIFIVTLSYVVYLKIRFRGKKLTKDIRDGLKGKAVGTFVVGLIVLLPLLFIFSYRYIYPLIRYHSPIPDCSKVLSVNRCMQSGVYKSEKNARQTKMERPVVGMEDYFLNWNETILMQLDTSGAVISEGNVHFGKSLPIIAYMLAMFYIVGIGLILFEWKTINLKTNGWKIVSVSAVATVLSVYLFNMASYYAYHIDMNVQARYLIPVMPIFIVLVLLAASYVKLNQYVKMITLFIVLLLLTQGGGIIKHVVTSDKTWIKTDRTTQQIYDEAKKILKPLVIED